MLNIEGKETDFRSKDGPTILGGVHYQVYTGQLVAAQPS
jgi:hypothetical protein